MANNLIFTTYKPTSRLKSHQHPGKKHNKMQLLDVTSKVCRMPNISGWWYTYPTTCSSLTAVTSVTSPALTVLLGTQVATEWHLASNFPGKVAGNMGICYGLSMG